ncbi:MAG: TetR/AcrR family transcriptional regulator [Gammaproteobacteria bacterium]|nr:TetR/AcrR family transcriptional regulator [Gammaproteobacteria bacterium]NIR85911.1 TetR/AcrR family transcriptional regulator [Gammaproteobacteria bacterium]NIR91903.1 TetR/AcrR family transcriptional regulator [Gammaproteobacteria bacterium]NIU07160.1 TetR/AcrR family transcriptional regulator [Gammaproteobacteria bacterium]NIV53973.1 TetR family transcriptional regulator [Gammaproteobacteria bacterium]
MATPKSIPTTVKDPDLVAQRRAEIVDVATRLFLKRGFHKTSIRDIARACPFNVASLYMYVSSKEDILFLVAQHLMAEKSRALQNVKTRSAGPVEALKTAFQKYCEIVDRYRPHIKLMYRELDVLPPDRQQTVLESEMAVVDVFEGLIAEGIRCDVFRSVEPRLLAHDAIFLAHMWALKHWSLKRFTTFQQFMAAQSDILLRTLIKPELSDDLMVSVNGGHREPQLPAPAYRGKPL